MTTKHATCTHPSTKAARAACRRGYTGRKPLPPMSDEAKTRIKAGGPTTSRGAKAEPEAKPEAAKIFIDSLGVKIEIGDRVIINAWGGNVRLTDVGSRGTVNGYGRSRIYVLWDDLADFPAGAVRSDLVAVLRRDGRKGFQGNVDR
jgi:hypothetical protein